MPIWTCILFTKLVEKKNSSVQLEPAALSHLKILTSEDPRIQPNQFYISTQQFVLLPAML